MRRHADTVCYPLLEEMRDRQCWSQGGLQKEADCKAVLKEMQYSSGRQVRAMNKRYDQCFVLMMKQERWTRGYKKIS